MKRLRSFLLLTFEDQKLLVKTWLILFAIRLALWTLPFGVLRRMVIEARPRAAGNGETDEQSINRIAWAVKLSSKYLPAATCLTQALTTLVLLKRGGGLANLKIGVAKDDQGKLQAHAWVESNGRIVIGNLSGISNFKGLS